MLKGIDKNSHQPLDNLISPAALEVLETSCFDCHSTVYQRYVYDTLPFVNIMISRHILEGLDDLNFSTLASQSLSDVTAAIEASIEEVEDEKMPLREYVFMHPKAKVDELKLNILKNELSALIKKYENSN